MDTREHPLRRRYGVELLLGGIVGLAAIVVLVGRDRGPDSSMAREGTPAKEEPAREHALADARTAPSRSAIEMGSSRPVHRARPASCPAQSFAVDVVDARGRPLGDVAVLLIAVDRAAPDDRRRERDVTSRKSDADGQAFFELALVEGAWERARAEGVQLLHRLTTPTNLPGTPRTELPERVADGHRFRLVLPDEIAKLFGKLAVRVVDRNGAPVGGAPVAWNAWPVERPAAIVHGGTGKTRAEDGVAELALDRLRELRWMERNSGGSHRFRVEVTLPFVGGAPAADLGDDPTGKSLVTLVLPGTGLVEARVTAADGTTVGEGVSVRAWGWSKSDPDDDAFLGEVPVVDGRATLELVGLGLELRISAFEEEHGHAPAWLEMPGPTRAGERVEVLLRLGPETTRLHFLAVDELGAPLVGAGLTGTLEVREPGKARSMQLALDGKTDQDGAVSFRLDGFPAGPRQCTLRLETTFTSGTKATHRLRSESALPPLQLGRENVLGALVLRGPPPSHPGILLASGTVLDDATGAPLAGARVSLFGAFPDDALAWAHGASTGIDGGFEIRGPPGLENLRLQGFATGHDPAGCAVETGSDTVLRLQREVTFAARVLLEPELPRRLLRFLLASEQGFEVVGELHELEHVRFRPPEPGKCAFEVRVRQSCEQDGEFAAGSWVLERIEGVRTDTTDVPFATPTDPRLDPLDLRGRIVLAPYALRGADGRALAGHRVRVRFDAREVRGRTDSQGRLGLVVPVRTRIELEPEGFLPIACSGSTEEQTLVFTPR